MSEKKTTLEDCSDRRCDNWPMFHFRTSRCPPAPSQTDEERDVWATEPESLTIRQLNSIVRRLREEVHKAKGASQARARSEGRREGLEEAVGWMRRHDCGFEWERVALLRALADAGKDGGK